MKLEIISKLRFYSCPDPLDLADSSKNDKNPTFKGSGHEKKLDFEDDSAQSYQFYARYQKVPPGF